MLMTGGVIAFRMMFGRGAMALRGGLVMLGRFRVTGIRHSNLRWRRQMRAAE
jgi:hypothetical protein